MYEPVSEIIAAKKFIKERLESGAVSFHSHQSEWKNVHDVLKRTIQEGESNSLLLIGPRGCGKTTLVNTVLYSLLQKPNHRKNTIIVHLNGLVHTDDKLALKATTAQMNLEMAIKEPKFKSFAENLAYLLDCLKSGNKESKSLIFILEELDLFCTHTNQTLLYNLFDVSQSPQIPLCVLGISCRLDVIELFEKRVKSRFSHRQVFLCPKSNEFEFRMELFKKLLWLPDDNEMRELLSSMRNIRKINFEPDMYFLRNYFHPFNYKFSRDFVNAWNFHIEQLASKKSVLEHIQSIYEYDINEKFFKTFLFNVISRVNDSHPNIESTDIYKICQVYETDHKVILMIGLSVVEICLIIAMKQHSEIFDRDPFNFQIIFTRFTNAAKIYKTIPNCDEPTALKNFENLRNLELIIPLQAVMSSVQEKYEMYKMALTYAQIGYAIRKIANLPTEIIQWAQSSLV